MAIRFERANSEAEIRSTDLLALTNYTWMAWVYLVSVPGWSEVFATQIGSGSNWYEWGASGGNWKFWETVGGTGTGSAYSLSTWYHVACVKAGTTAYLYINGGLDITVPSCTAPSSWGNMSVACYASGGVPSGEYLDGRVYAQKAWNTNLSQAEIQQEMYTILPRKLTDLYAFWPCLPGSSERVRDWSGNGRDWTDYTGGLSDEAEPPISWGGQMTMRYPFVAAAAGQKVPLKMDTYRRLRG